ncbi:MAG: orotidine-5'-phosphate decarboxylase [Bacteroidota bacterium]
MTRAELFDIIKKKRSFLCIGLDTDLNLIPRHLHGTGDPVFEFNKQIIDATKDLCAAYKPNTAFYESLGSAGWESLEKTIHYIRDTCPDVFSIADAKRGDIGNTSAMYARCFFDLMDFDAVTVAPYMGEDSVTPFLQYEGKWVILLALTSNKGADDFQKPGRLFENVLNISRKWGDADNLMYVIGATQAGMLAEVRKIVPDNFLLVPGIGAQGGSLQEVARYGMNAQCGLLVNSSRSIIYAGSGHDFAEKARAEAMRIQEEMQGLLKGAEII